MDAGYVKADEESSTRTTVADPEAVWPTDVFGGIHEGTELAHLIPHSAFNASMYHDVALCAFGFKENEDWETLMKAIHGSSLGPGTTLEPNTGIKHRVPNKIRLSDQKKYLDAFPCLLTVPILDMNAVNSWNGDEYDAIVMVEGWENVDPSMACREVRMTRPARRTARLEEIEKARKLLEQFVLGLAYSLSKRTDRVADPRISAELEKIQKTFLESVTGGVILPTPVENPDPPAAELRVYVVEFANAFGDAAAADARHPAPDPLLLAARAAVTWSRRNNQQLLPVDDPTDKEDWDELDQLAAEQHADESHRRWRPRSRLDLARGLCQLDVACDTS